MNHEQKQRPEREQRHRQDKDHGPQGQGAASLQGAASGQQGAGDALRQARLSLGELTEAAGVSVRTVRYYIAEGLLPPPEGSGPGSFYSPGHLDRLRLIQQLKEDYLPLKEIRRRIAGLSDAEVHDFLARDAATGPSANEVVSGVPLDSALAGARDYLALMESRARYRTEPLALSFSAVSQAADAGVPGTDTLASHAERSGLRRRAASDIGDVPSGDEALWRRIPLGREAELVISDRVYARHGDRIDWLVRWARKVFD